MPTKKGNGETTLVNLAESIGSALGAVTATAKKAKQAVVPKTSARRQRKRKARGSPRRVSPKVVATPKASRKSGR